MKKIILALGFSLLMMGCNQQKKMEKMTTKLVDRINAACQLTPDQNGKILPIAENFIKIRKETRDKDEGNQDALKNDMEINRKKFMDTLKTILSPDQFEKLKIFFQQQKAKQNGQDGGE